MHGRAGASPVMEHDIMGVRDITVHPENPGRMLFQGLGFHHWISEDFGETFQVCCVFHALAAHSLHPIGQVY